MKRCSVCVTPVTRPRLELNKEGVCNACTHHENKKTKINWKDKRKELEAICNEHRSVKPFNCIVPVSGGKDSSTVAWAMKHKFGMNPLCVTFREPMQTWIGRQNLENFIQSGFDHIMVSPDVQAYRKFNKDWFIEKGMPKQAFVVGISTSVIRIANHFDISLCVWGEQGEVEYGGKSEPTKKFTRDFLIDVYYEGQKDSEKYGPWWKVPTQKELDKVENIWYSNYHDWDPEKHAIFAKQHCGLELLVGGSIGTFTNHSQLSDVIQDLHCYLQFLKFGFGRCTSDASIEIRRGRLKRSEGVRIVNEIDGLFPLEYQDAFCSYFDMTEKEFWDVLGGFANMELLRKTTDKERPYVTKIPCA